MACGDPALPPALRAALQAAFRGVRAQRGAWEGALAGCAPLVASLGNLAEQMRASEKVAFGRGPLRGLPDLPARLRSKHRGAAEALLARLRQEKLPELRKVRDAVGACVANVFLLCEGRRGEPGLEESLRRSPLVPSLADMLEWLLDARGFYHRRYLEAKLLLLQLRYENLAEMQALPGAWERVMRRGLQSPVEDALLKVSFFLEEAA